MKIKKNLCLFYEYITAQPGPPQPPQYQHIYPPLSTGDNYPQPAQYPGGAPMSSQPPGYPQSGPPAYQPVAGPPHTARSVRETKFGNKLITF